MLIDKPSGCEVIWPGRLQGLERGRQVRQAAPPDPARPSSARSGADSGSARRSCPHAHRTGDGGRLTSPPQPITTRSTYRETAPPWFQLPWPRSRACRFRLWTWAPPLGDVAEPARRPSASPHDRRTCNRPETGTRLSLSPSWSPPSSNGLIETSRRGGESRSLALVPAARKAPASFSPWRAGISRGLRACCVISTLVGRSQDRRWGLPRLRF